jgi:hypothetical protein
MQTAYQIWAGATQLGKTMANVFEGTPDARQSDDPAHPLTRFRPTYRALSDEEKALHDDIKHAAMLLEALILRTPAGEYRVDAIKSLELAVMWSVKGLTQ